MKRRLLIGAFVFSVALNLAAASTVAWRFWRAPFHPCFPPEGYQALTPKDFDEIRRLARPDTPHPKREKHRRIHEKRAEIIDILAREPENLAAIEKPLAELGSLRANSDRAAMLRLSRIMARLSPEKRESFASFLKHRPFAGKGMGMGKGMGPDGCAPGHDPGACPPQN